MKSPTGVLLIAFAHFLYALTGRGAPSPRSIDKAIEILQAADVVAVVAPADRRAGLATFCISEIWKAKKFLDVSQLGPPTEGKADAALLLIDLGSDQNSTQQVIQRVRYIPIADGAVVLDLADGPHRFGFLELRLAWMLQTLTRDHP